MSCTDLMMDGVSLLHGDCLARMGELVDGCVDLVVCDLPYGTTDCKWDTVIPFEPLWTEYRRVLKPGGILAFTSAQPFTTDLINSNRAWFKHSLVWRKNVAVGHLRANKCPMRGHEDILIFGSKGGTYNPQKTKGHPSVTTTSNNSASSIYIVKTIKPPCVSGTERHPTSVLDFKVEREHYSTGKRLHPTQKPVALMEWLVRSYSNAGDLVLDNAMGSGTTGIACMNAGRRFVGIEMDDAYFAAACQRIASHVIADQAA